MNYYSNNLKHTARKLFYILLGWSAIIFLVMLVSFLCNLGIDMHLTPTVDIDIVIIILALLLIYILVFSNCLCFNLLGSLGIASLFFIVEGIVGILAKIIIYSIASLVIIGIGVFNGDFSISMFFDDIWKLILFEGFLSYKKDFLIFEATTLFFQSCLFFLLFPISYWLWCDILKKRKYCIYIHKKLRYCLHLLILISPPFLLSLLLFLHDFFSK